MGKVYDTIDASIREWMQTQQVFFVASAPAATDGLINCSPKGLDTLRVIDERTIAYLDYTGSGIETVAHVRENGRIVVMMCSFEGSPRIMRFHGVGAVAEVGSPRFQELAAHFSLATGVRSIIEIRLTRISDSCGWSVPLYSYQGQRETLSKWAKEQGDQSIKDYQRRSNRKSLDGLPGLAGA